MLVRNSYLAIVVVSMLLAACQTSPRSIKVDTAKPAPELKARVMDVGSSNVASQIKVYGHIPDSFENSYWQFVQVKGQRMAKSDLAPVARFKVGEVSGFTGCNTFVANYKRDGLWLSITGLKMGNQPCDSVLPQHQLVQRALSQVRSIRIIESNDYLAMLDANNKLLAELKPLKVKEGS